MITDVALPEGAFSICWGCASYEWAISLGVKNKWNHFCANGLEAGDDVKDCKEYVKK